MGCMATFCRSLSSPRKTSTNTNRMVQLQANDVDKG
jgi:hypothetical protein